MTDEFVEKIDNMVCDDHRLTLDKLPAMFLEISGSLLHKESEKLLDIGNCLQGGS